ncbi:hypothetical protein AB832_07340 [Flavobacteriaceae bacterium (ex Bugula neritina AB1)]|nr:hypothetical protein AB832_07340 [Flavobacteriaceae bacterium (ex Bugula neritina AB1)]
MTDIIWPDELGEPLQKGYGYTLPPLNRTRRINSPSVTRNTASTTIVVFSCSYRWTDSQLSRFYRFCDDDLQHKSAWFKQTLIMGFIKQPQTVRLLNVGKAQKRGHDWELSLSLECNDFSVISDDEAEILLMFREEDATKISSSSNQFYQSINYTIPRIWHKTHKPTA